MALGRSGTSPYEVRCPRCDVTFPVETRKCFHCGGRTVPSSHQPAAVDIVTGSTDVVTHPMSVDAMRHGPVPIEPEAESPFSIGDTGFGETAPNDRALDLPDEPTSIGRMIFRSLGGIIWVVLLIAFSLARDCGE